MENSGEIKSESVRERFKRTLGERADSIKSVRNDVYTLKYGQLCVYFLLCLAGVVFLVLALVYDGGTSKLFMALSIGAIVCVIALSMVFKAIAPTSFLQYFVSDKGKDYSLYILSKTRTVFSDGENHVASDRLTFEKLDEPPMPEYRYDFFRAMDAEVRIGKPDREIFKGTLEVGGKRVRCKIVFKSGEPYYGVIGGARIKYFDVNNVKEIFVVPSDIKMAAEYFGVDFPKLPGVHIVDSHVNAKRQ